MKDINNHKITEQEFTKDIGHRTEGTKTSTAYTKVPCSLSLKVLERFIPKEKLDKLKKEYVLERNKGFQRGDRGNYCPHCGGKLQVLKK